MAELSSKCILDDSFGRSCLPSTMGIASRFRSDILKRLDAVHPEWPYEDRVLVWMLPNLENDAVAYHRAAGGDMGTMFAAHQLEHFDQSLAVELLRRLDSPPAVE
jgi:hypothetical protein